MDTTTYILLKDVPELDAGTLFTWDERLMAYTTEKHRSTSLPIYAYRKELVENSPNWFKKEEPKQLECRICAVRDTDGKLFYTDMLPTKGETIDTVERLSDNEVFSVGDKVKLHTRGYTHIPAFTIKDIYTNDGNIFIDKDGGKFNLIALEKVKEEPEPIPESKYEPIKKAIESVLNDYGVTKAVFKDLASYNLSDELEKIRKKGEQLEQWINETTMPLPLVDDRELFSMNDIASCYSSSKDSPLYREFQYQLYRLLENKIKSLKK